MRTVYDKRTTFTAMDGTEIHFKPFSYAAYEIGLENLRQEYRTAGKPIDKPQYTVTFASGSQQKIDHDETTILKAPPGTLPEDVERIIGEQMAAWKAWQDTTAEFAKENNDLLWDYVRNDSLSDLKLPDDNSWELKQARRHMKVPTDPEEKLMHYLTTELLKSTADMLEFLETIALVSRGIVEEAHLETAKKSFRDSLWSDGLAKLAKRDAARKAEDTPDGRVDGERPADHPTSYEIIRD